MYVRFDRQSASLNGALSRLIPALLLLLGAGAPTPAFAQPNFVVIVTDDQRWDMAFAMPNVTTRISDVGIRFSNAFTTTPVCGPTRASFHAGGFRPNNTGIIANTFPNGGAAQFNDSQTVGTAFYEAGYKTLHLGKYLNGYPQDLEPYIPPGWTRFVHASTVGGSTELPGVGTTVPVAPLQRLENYRVHALDFIDEFHASPFFVMLETERPHYPSIPLSEDLGLFPGFLYRERGSGESDLSDKPPIIQVRARDYPDWYVASVEEEDEFRRDQLRSVYGIDRMIGAIIDKLEEKNVLDNTVIVFVSDNGYLWGEHRQFGKGLAYEESLRVPLTMRIPGMPSGDVDHLVAWDLDLPATLFDLAGITAPTEGTSFLPVVNDPLAPWRTELVSEFWDNQLTWAALRTIEPAGEEWKYVEWGTGERELYDLGNDPYELQSQHDNPAFAAVAADLETRRASHPRSLMISLIGPYIQPGNVGTPYSRYFDVWGGSAPYAWDTFGSALPPGLTLDPLTGYISGTPTKGGSYEFDVAVYDSGERTHAGGPRRFVKHVKMDIAPIPAVAVPAMSGWGLGWLVAFLGGSAISRLVSRRP